jgi:hypothetical protein
MNGLMDKNKPKGRFTKLGINILKNKESYFLIAQGIMIGAIKA